MLQRTPVPSIGTLIGISGWPASGKTTLAMKLSTRMNAPRYSCGDFIRARADGEDLQTFGQRYVMERGGKGFVADFVAFYGIESLSHCIIEGIRHFAVWEAFTAHANTSLLVFLNIARSVIHSRLWNRSERPCRDQNIRLAHPVEAGVPELMNIAEIVITEPDLDFAVKAIIERVKIA